jgi:hypothetical protein
MSLPTQPKKTVYLVFDIETAGKDLHHSFLAVGMCYGDFEKGVICDEVLAVNDGKGINFEPRCLYEFWSKHLDVLKALEKAGKPIDLQMDRLRDWLSWFDNEYKDYNVKILSDNPAFDIARLDHHFVRESRGHSVRYSRSGIYRSIEDPSERLEALLLTETANKIIPDLIPNYVPHNPSSDAQYIFWQHVIASAATNMLRDGKKGCKSLQDVRQYLEKIAPWGELIPESKNLFKNILLSLARGEQIQ